MEEFRTKLERMKQDMDDLLYANQQMEIDKVYLRQDITRKNSMLEEAEVRIRELEKNVAELLLRSVKVEALMKEVLSFIDNMDTKSPPIQIVVGGTTGLLSGYLFTQGSRATASVLGISLLAFQFCNYRGYIKLNRSKFESDLKELRRQVEDELYGRGANINISDKNMVNFISENAWILSGFAAGCLLGYGLA